MGCGVSKLEPGEGRASGLQSVRINTSRRRNDGPRARKDSNVSSTGLLHPEELLDDVGAPPAADKMATMTIPPHVEAKCVGPEEQGGEEKLPQQLKKRAGAGGEEEEDVGAAGEKRKGAGEVVKRAPCSRGPALADGRRARLGNDDEEDPGSPSFRVYFVDPTRDSSDDDSVSSGAVDSNNPAGKTKGKKCRPIRADSIKSITSEESEGKISKRQIKARRFKGLTKRPAGAVYGRLLNVRSWYSTPSTTGGDVDVQESSTGLPPPSQSSSSSTTAGRTSSATAPSDNHCPVSEKVA